MKSWQFCMLMATIYAAPLEPKWINLVAVAVFLAASAFEIVKGR